MTVKIKPGYGFMDGTATANYTDNDMDLRTQSNHVKFKNDSANALDVVFNTEVEGNPTIQRDMVVLGNEEIDLDELQVSRVAVKGNGAFRVWAYSRI